MLNSDEMAKIINYYPVLEQLSPGLLQALVDSSYPIRAHAGQVLFDVDLPIQSFLMLTNGSVRVVWQSEDRELLLYRIQPGECCVLTICHLLDETSFPARAQAESTIAGVALPQPLFKQMVEESSLFCTFILHSLTFRLTEILELLTAQISTQLDQRLAGVLLSRGPLIEATHSQLADELGSVREVISRILKDFEKKGLIQLERGQIQILDKKSLEQMIRFGDSSH